MPDFSGWLGLSFFLSLSSKCFLDVLAFHLVILLFVCSSYLHALGAFLHLLFISFVHLSTHYRQHLHLLYLSLLSPLTIGIPAGQGQSSEDEEHIFRSFLRSLLLAYLSVITSAMTAMAINAIARHHYFSDNVVITHHAPVELGRQNSLCIA